MFTFKYQKVFYVLQSTKPLKVHLRRIHTTEK